MSDSYLHRLQEAIEAATRGMTAEQLSRHPQGKWSCSEVLEHLYLTYTGTIKGLQRCLETGKPLASAPTLKQRLFKFVVVNGGYMPSGRKAPEMTVPKGTSAAMVVQEIVPTITKMEALIAQSEARFGYGARVLNHPVLGPLTGRQWRKFHWVHGMHHVKQIERLRAYE